MAIRINRKLTASERLAVAVEVAHRERALGRPTARGDGGLRHRRCLDGEPALLSGRVRAGQLMRVRATSPRLLAAATAVLAGFFAWAAWLSFAAPPQRVSALSAVLEIAVAVAVVQIARGPEAGAGRAGLLLAALTLLLGAVRYFPAAFNESTRTVEGVLSAVAAVLFAAASLYRLKNTRPPRLDA